MLVRDEASDNVMARRNPQIIGIYCDAFEQLIRVRGQLVAFKFVNKLEAFVWNDSVYPSCFEGRGREEWTTVNMPSGPPVKVKFGRLPGACIPGAVNLIGMESVPLRTSASTTGATGGGDTAPTGKSLANSLLVVNHGTWITFFVILRIFFSKRDIKTNARNWNKELSLCFFFTVFKAVLTMTPFFPKNACRYLLTCDSSETR